MKNAAVIARLPRPGGRWFEASGPRAEPCGTPLQIGFLWFPLPPLRLFPAVASLTVVVSLRVSPVRPRRVHLRPRRLHPRGVALRRRQRLQGLVRRGQLHGGTPHLRGQQLPVSHGSLRPPALDVRRGRRLPGRLGRGPPILRYASALQPPPPPPRRELVTFPSWDFRGAPVQRLPVLQPHLPSCLRPLQRRPGVSGRRRRAELR